MSYNSPKVNDWFPILGKISLFPIIYDSIFSWLFVVLPPLIYWIFKRVFHSVSVWGAMVGEV